MPVTYNKVLCAVNLAECAAEEVVKHAASICKRYGATLHLLYSLEEKSVEFLVSRLSKAVSGEALREYGQLLSTLEERDARVLQDLAQKSEDLWECQVETTISRGEPYMEILETAQRIGADMIVVGSHSAPVLGKVLLGSTAEKVLHRTICPVLLVPLGKE